MKKNGMILLTAALFLFGSLIPSLAADASKIGIVDFQKILADSSTGKQAKAEINKKGKELEASLKEKGMEIEELKNKIQRESLVMSKEKREEKQRELRIKINDFKSLQKNYTEKFKQMEGRLVNKIKKEVLDIAKKIGEQQDYLMILERNEAGAIYFSDSLDITDAVIEAYNDKN